MNPFLAAITEIFGSTKELMKLVSQILAGAEVRKLKYNKEAGQNYILVNEKGGQYKDIADDRQAKLLLHFRKQAFDE